MAKNYQDEESNPLLPLPEKKTPPPPPAAVADNLVKEPPIAAEDPVKEPPISAADPVKKPPVGPAGDWTVDGLPVGHVNVVGELAVAAGGRSQWNSGLFSCFGRNDEFCSSDVEVCLLGSIAPCILYGSNEERLTARPGSFANNCLPYTALYMLGNALFGWNCVAPWYSYTTRSSIRHKFNLEGSFEAFSRSCGCCRGLTQDSENLERIELACDLATHYLCHPCALCQEGRELRRRLPHPGFFSNARPVFVMAPPSEQSMKP